MKAPFYIILTTSALAAIVSLIFFLNYNEIKSKEIINDNNNNWRIKEKDNRDRLFTVPILLYHNIDGKGVFSINLETIRAHFTLLKENNIKVIKLSEFIQRLEKPEPYKEKAVVISFDDGYFSMYKKLMPLAKEFGYPITLFIYTNNVYNKSIKNLTWHNLREMEKNGIEIECHTISHQDLVRLADRNSDESKKSLYEEIYLSKRILELYLDKQIKYFSLPYGSYNLKIIDLCANSGYKRVFSTIYGPNIITRNNYCLRRRHIKRDYSMDTIKDLTN